MCDTNYNNIMYIYVLFFILMSKLISFPALSASNCELIKDKFSTLDYYEREISSAQKRNYHNCYAEMICAKYLNSYGSSCHDFSNPDLISHNKPENIIGTERHLFTYKGNFKHGLFDGEGNKTYKNGTLYEGQFVKGNKQGIGKQTTKTINGFIIREGEWWYDSHYKGTFVYPSSNNTNGIYKMSGEFNRDTRDSKCYGQLEGQGKFESLYEKPFIYNSGIVSYGFVLEGIFKCSSLVKGKEFNDYENYSTTYDGEFDKNEFYSGKGLLTISRKKNLKKDDYLHDGKKIKIISGNFKNNYLDNGKMTFVDGSSLEGYFIKGKFSPPKTKYMLGKDYKNGSNDKIQNYKLAKDNFLLAAKDGYKNAMSELAKLYKEQVIKPELTFLEKLKSFINGKHYIQKISLLKAHMWANLAGDTKLRDSINLDDIHVLEAQRLANDCKQKDYKNC